MRQISLAFSLTLATAAALAQTVPAPDARPFGVSRPIENQYIVVFKRDVTQPSALAAQLAQQHGGQVMHTYTSALKGFAGRLPDAAITALRNNPNVAFVEQDATVSLNETLISPANSQAPATWGLDRIDLPALQLNGTYNYQYTGAGVYAFVIDTGILSTHNEFGGRAATPGYTAIIDGNGTTDCNGHGTHVAGTVGGNTYGVAKGVTLVPVRVLGCTGSGTNSGVIAGVDWVAKSTLRPAVANMSLGGGFSSATNASVAGAVAAGVTMVVAAGNDNRNACNYSPASAPSAITVGATTSSDARSSYSNFGTCLDIFAPGSSITSAWYTGTTVTNTISGTSMASPHVAGVAALALAANPSATPALVADFLVANATLGKVTSAGTGSPNRLVYSMAAGAPSVPVVKTVAVSAITGKGVKSGSKWVATATVTVKEYSGSAFAGAIAGATVTGTFTPGGSKSCVTTSTGSCTLTSASISRTYTTSSFSVGNVTDSGSYLNYDASKNVATTWSVPRP